MSELSRRKLIYATTAVVALAWTLIDQATKVWAVRALEGARPNDLGPVIMRVIRNDGGAFSLPIDLPWLFVAVTVIVLVLVVRALPDTDSLPLATAYGLVLGGALGNGADRIFRSSGAVVDMIDLDFAPLENFPVFNVADIGITVGAVLVALLMFQAERAANRKPEPAVLEDPHKTSAIIATGGEPPPARSVEPDDERVAVPPPPNSVPPPPA